ncbi:MULTISPECIES: hypothetical protein [unclassified Mucilaginibacter]|uniref:hypothetical protein n=1 Tax=unclassified Mucilaginibacter TaxID=2617802 RepID=UPI000959066D|nr:MULTISPECIES: hypothetical protein [unclassified Mucilaginibacter]OJW13465.1 MAG: hypothetical protein BGO48_01530 [Mucilaginibacter sp. 44-25]PLW89234.1 MAG: hypothetical protein C0154_12655 [Mucilaginibacter sp.]HEK20538.1 hypothetical protein [Bacteroidota bacterium]
MFAAILPPDGGLVYTETNLHHFFPEPWNMVSSALFLIPGIYWLIKLKGFNRQYTFLSIATWLLLTGCVGSTVYHGLRKWRFFIMMDWLPIAILCLLASVYFWIKFSGRMYVGAIALIVFLALTFSIRKLMPRYDIQLLISLNYTVMVLMIVLPLMLLLWRLHWQNSGLVFGALLAFGIAIGFRVYDKYTTLSIGTHFLWHTFGAIATSLMFVFIYRINGIKTQS